MLRFTVLLVLGLVIPDLYIFLIYLTRRIRSRTLRCLYWLPTAILVIMYIFVMHVASKNAMHDYVRTIGWLAILSTLFAVPKTIFMIVSLIGSGLHRIFRRCPTKPFTITGMVLGGIFFSIALYGCTLGISRYTLKEVEYSSERLPEAFDGYRIVQLTDIHIGSYKYIPDQVEKIVSICNDQNPDLTVFTGDLVNQKSDEVYQFIPALSRLRAKDGVYSILGNHDYGLYYKWDSMKDREQDSTQMLLAHEAMGWHLLNNANAIIHRRNDSIALLGVENEGLKSKPCRADLPAALEGTDGMFKILLSHDPTHWKMEVLPESDIDLTLSGHTHGMQMKMFGHSPAELLYDEWSGMYYSGRRALYVSEGVGFVGLPFRFGAWPEITVITLRKVR